MKVFISILLFTISIFAVDIKPFKEIVAKGAVKDMVIDENLLVIGTDAGVMQVYDINKSEFIKEVKIPDIKYFMGDTINARVSSVDKIDNSYLLLSDSGIGGYSNLKIEKDGKIDWVIKPEDKLPIIKARFIDKEHILLGFLSNEVALFNIKTKKMKYRVQLSESKFSDFALNEDKTLAAFSCESGEITIVETKSGKIIKRLSKLNVDNVYKVDFKKDFVSCAGQDRRGSWYNIKSGNGDYVQGNFLIYATALSPDATKVAFAWDEKNNIVIFNRDTKSKLYTLKGQKSTLNTIIYKSENELFSASDDKTIIEWKLK